MAYSSTVRYYGTVNGMSVKITEIVSNGSRSYKVAITTKGVSKGNYFSPPVSGAESFVNIEDSLLYIKRQTDCSNSAISTIKASMGK